MEALAVPFLLLVGALLAVQAGANVQLSAAMAHPVGASALQLTIGAALLTTLAAALGSLGVSEVFTPGANTDEIVEFVRGAVNS